MKKVNKRIGIFSYDNPGAKTYKDLLFLINEVKEFCSQIIVVTNGNSDKIRDGLSTDIIFIDGVYGFDANRWQRGIEYLYSNYICKDVGEIILFNDSIFGPFEKLDCVFRKMAESECDFWGITYHEKIEYINKKKRVYIPKHLQTYFMVFKSKIIKSDEFINFWKGLPLIKDVETYQKKFEFCLCPIFEKVGYKWDSYIDTTDIDSEDGKSFIDHFILEPYYLIINKGLPVISRHSFSVSKEVQLCYHDGSELYRAFEHIKNNTEYDENLIFDYLIENYNVYDINKMLNLTYIVDDKCYRPVLQYGNVAIFVHLYYEDLFDYCIRYISNLPSFIDIYVSTDEENKKKEIEMLLAKNVSNQCNVYVVEKRGREWSAFLMNVHKFMERYDYMGFIHDKKSSQMFFSSIGRNFCNTLWENVVGQKNSACQILDIFESNPRIGILCAPSIYCGTFFHTAIDFWSRCFEKTTEIMNMLGLEAPLSREKNPIAIGTAFWCRTDALKQLFRYEFEYDMFPEEPMDIDGTFSHGLERAIPYIAQANGYATGIVMSKAWTLTEISNKNYMVNVILRKLKKIKKTRWCLNTFYDLSRTL